MGSRGVPRNQVRQLGPVTQMGDPQTHRGESATSNDTSSINSARPPDRPSIFRALALKVPQVQALATTVIRRPNLWSASVLVLLVIFFSFASPHFFTQAAWAAIALTASVTLILAFGEVFVIIGGGLDISYAGVIGLTGIAGGMVMGHFGDQKMNPSLAILFGFLVMVAIGTLVGLINGLVVTRLRVNPFIATLAMSSAALGVGELLNKGADVNNIPSSIITIGNDVILEGWLPVPMLIAAGFGIAAAIVLHKTRFGAWTYLIGSNIAASRRAGIPVERHLVKLYMVSGALAGVASFLIVARLGLATPGAGVGDELAAVAICVIGGASLSGGRGSIAGCFIGAGIVTVLLIGLIIAGVESFWQLVTTGIILVGAVWLDQQRIRVQSRVVELADESQGRGTGPQRRWLRR
jgi:ribose transport system permease protein